MGPAEIPLRENFGGVAGVEHVGRGWFGQLNSFLLFRAIWEYSFYLTVCGRRHAPVIRPPGTARFYYTTHLRLQAYSR